MYVCNKEDNQNVILCSKINMSCGFCFHFKFFSELTVWWLLTFVFSLCILCTKVMSRRNVHSFNKLGFGPKISRHKFIWRILSSSGSRNYSLKVYCQAQIKINSLGLPWTPGAWNYNCNATHPPTTTRKLLSKGPSINSLIKRYVSAREVKVWFSTLQFSSI